MPSSFDQSLLVAADELEYELRGLSVPWSEFLLNPRRLRGSDFLMRWSQGAWSERRLVEAVNATQAFFALEYGPGGTAPENDVQAYELYFERLDHAGLRGLKRPDLLVFRAQDRAIVERIVNELGGVQELPFTQETQYALKTLLSRAVVAIECENSLWRARQMPAFNSPLKPQRRLGGRPGLTKNAVLPTVILKEEDRAPLRDWQDARHVPIHIWHAFFDVAYGIALDRAEQLIDSGLIEGSEQTFQAPGGATTTKTIYKIYYHYAYPLGHAEQEPRLVAESITDKNGHILPYVRFEGGRLRLSPEALDELRRMPGR